MFCVKAPNDHMTTPTPPCIPTLPLSIPSSMWLEGVPSRDLNLNQCPITTISLGSLIMILEGLHVCLFAVFETMFHYIVLADTELSMQNKELPASASQLWELKTHAIMLNLFWGFFGIGSQDAVLIGLELEILIRLAWNLR